MGRVVARFSLIAAAGEMASERGRTGWESGVALEAVRQCMAAWLQERGHLGNHEDMGVMEQIKRFFTANQYARFAD